MQSEHPPEESEAVIQRGRVLGGLEPTRAFGDARYKWTREIQERYMAFLVSYLPQLTQ
jgi:pyruvate dehydrogenase phosphatase